MRQLQVLTDIAVSHRKFQRSIQSVHFTRSSHIPSITILALVAVPL